MRLTPLKALMLALVASVGWTYRGEISKSVSDLEDAGTRLATWMEMNELAEGMRAHLRTDDPPSSFSNWIDRRFPAKNKNGVERRSSRDRYGMPYLLEMSRGGRATIRSCGPDMSCRSDDDIEVEVKVDR